MLIFCVAKIQLPAPSYGKIGLADYSHYIRLFHDKQVFAVNFDFSAAPFAEKDLVAFFDIELVVAAIVIACAWAYGNDFAFRRLFCGCIRNDDTAGCFCIFFDALNNNAVMEGTKFYTSISLFWVSKYL